GAPSPDGRGPCRAAGRPGRSTPGRRARGESTPAVGYHPRVTPPGKSGRTLQIAVSLGLAALLLYLFLRTMDFAAVAPRIRLARAGWLVFATLAGLVATPVFRSWRWGFLLRKAGRASAWELNSATAIGFAASTLLPARAGEIVRPVALSRSGGLPLAPCLA